MELGKLEEVDIRKIWAHEQYDFWNWMSKCPFSSDVNRTT